MEVVGLWIDQLEILFMGEHKGAGKRKKKKLNTIKILLWGLVPMVVQGVKGCSASKSASYRRALDKQWRMVIVLGLLASAWDT